MQEVTSSNLVISRRRRTRKEERWERKFEKIEDGDNRWRSIGGSECKEKSWRKINGDQRGSERKRKPN
jgi:hypothetical protein